MNLRQLFRRALQASVIAPVALAGCGPDTTGYVPVECDNSQFSVRGLQPSVIPDVIQLRSVSGREFDEMASSMPFKVSTEGTVCGTASARATCESSFDALAPMSGFAAQCVQLCVDYHLATTKGDEVKAVASLEELKLFLGPIDMPQEALFIAFAHGYRLSCGQADRGAAKANGVNWDVIATKGFACGAGSALTRHYLSVTREGELTETRAELIERGAPNCAIGRRPPGLDASLPLPAGERVGERAVVGRFFAEAAHLEAASVPAFERLSLELALHGAPVELREAMLSAALEELQHTRITSSLAREFGATPRVPEVTERPLRTLFELALDNATEGCVRETFGALVAQHQAMRAQDPRIREAMTVIARDELRHAELSWALNEWAESQLAEEDREKLRAARNAALEKLRVELETEVDDALVREAGMPSAAVAQQLFANVSLSLR